MGSEDRSESLHALPGKNHVIACQHNTTMPDFGATLIASTLGNGSASFAVIVFDKRLDQVSQVQHAHLAGLVLQPQHRPRCCKPAADMSNAVACRKAEEPLGRARLHRKSQNRKTGRSTPARIQPTKPTQWYSLSCTHKSN